MAFLRSLEAKGINTRDLTARADSPFMFVTPSGNVAHGYEATILPDICAVIIDAAQHDALAPQQRHLARLTTLMDAVLMDYPNGGGWPVFMAKVNVILPAFDKNYELSLGDRKPAIQEDG